MDLIALRARAHHLTPAVRIGKAGLSEGIVAETLKHIKKQKLVKVKFLKAFSELYDVREAAGELARKTSSTLVQQVGDTVVLYRG